MIDDFAKECRVYSAGDGHIGTIARPSSGPAVVVWDIGGSPTSPLADVPPNLVRLDEHPLAGMILHGYRHGQRVLATDGSGDDPDEGTVHLALIDGRLTGDVVWDLDGGIAADPLHDVLGIIEPARQ